MRQLIIVGAGGFGRELYELLWDAFSPDMYQVKGFLAADVVDLRAMGIDHEVIGNPDTYQPESDELFLLAIGHMDVRKRVVEQLESRGGRFTSFIHPLARIAKTAKIADGAVIYPNAVVSNQSELAEHVHLNFFASVGHDCRVGRYCLLAPYATLNGNVRLEDEVYVSTHGTVAPGCRLGRRSKLSANSACMRDTPENTLVFGVPGRQVRRLD
jgi:sugar O-acyltransferase (sialic acid O-acetyltransferase NeuD family)